jgi:hypothetical protein
MGANVISDNFPVSMYDAITIIYGQYALHNMLNLIKLHYEHIGVFTHFWVFYIPFDTVIFWLHTIFPKVNTYACYHFTPHSNSSQ